MTSQENAFIARERRRLAHEVGSHGEGRAGRKGDTAHGKGDRVVVGVNESGGVLKNGLLILDDVIRRESAFGNAKRHTSAHGMKADTNLLCGANLLINQHARQVGGKEIHDRHWISSEDILK